MIILSFIKQTLTTFSTQISVVLISFIISLIISRSLGPTGYGIYSIVILISTLILNLGSLGIGISNIYFTGKGFDISQITSNSIILSVFLGSFSALTFFVILNMFPNVLKDVDFNLLLMIIIVMPMIFLTNFFSSILLGMQKIYRYNFIIFTQNFFILFLLLGFLFFIKESIFFVILAWSFASIISGIISIILINKVIKLKINFDTNLFKKTLQFGLKSYVSNIVGFLLYRIDMFIVNFFLGIVFVGYYSISVMLAETLWYLPSSVGTVILSHTLNLKESQSNELTPIICRNTIFITIIFAILLLIFGNHIIIAFFGNAFEPSILPLQILLIGVVAMSINKILSNELIARGMPLIGAIAALIALSINLPLNILLIPKLGLSGAALSSTIAYSISTIFPIYIFTKVSQKNIFDILIINKKDLLLYKTIFYKFLHRS